MSNTPIGDEEMITFTFKKWSCHVGEDDALFPNGEKTRSRLRDEQKGAGQGESVFADARAAAVPSSVAYAAEQSFAGKAGWKRTHDRSIAAE